MDQSLRFHPDKSAYRRLLGVGVNDRDRWMSAAARARWLAELAVALTDARQTVSELRELSGDDGGASFAERLDRAIDTVDSLRRGRTVAKREQSGRKWIEFAPSDPDSSVKPPEAGLRRR